MLFLFLLLFLILFPMVNGLLLSLLNVQLTLQNQFIRHPPSTSGLDLRCPNASDSLCFAEHQWERSYPLNPTICSTTTEEQIRRCYFAPLA